MTQSKSKEKFNITEFLGNVFRHQMFIPIAALLLLILFNVFKNPEFFEITIRVSSTGHKILSGPIISVLDNGSELAILAIGMTLVTAACGGQDISVGATIAITGSTIVRILCGSEARTDSTTWGMIALAFLVACLVGVVCGAFNGVLVSVFKIQPMIATLILYTAGRSIAAWINENKLPQVNDPIFKYIGGFIPGVPIPTPVFIAILCMIIIALVLKFTNIGLYTQAVGVNENSAKLNGINPVFIKILSFVILGLCVAVCGLTFVSRSSINYSVIAKDIEMDAILAVALGGNALSGGKFNMKASIIGAYIIQFLKTTLYAQNVASVALPAYKAVVVIILVVMSAPIVREKISSLGKKFKKNVNAKEVG